MAFGAAIAVLATVFLSWLAGSRWPDVLPEVTFSDTPDFEGGFGRQLLAAIAAAVVVSIVTAVVSAVLPDGR